MNHVHFQDRLDFVRDILRHRFAAEVINIEPIEYEADCPFDYNNFIYKVNIDGICQQDQQFGTTPLVAKTSHIIMRLSNPASGLPDHNRIENEVGMMCLFRQALARYDLGHLIPAVYAWGSAEAGQGWILQEFKQGSQLDKIFETASDALKQSNFSQMADVVHAMQSFEVPQTVTGYGGVSFSPDGAIVSGPMTTLSKGPSETYTELFEAFLQQQLVASDKSPVLEGWQEDGIRDRLDRFCVEKLPEMTSAFISPIKAIVHSDLTMNNMLIDESTGRLVALLDFDWAFVGSLQDEFLRSFCDLGMIPGPDSEGDELVLRRVLLYGDDSGLSLESLDDVLPKWYQTLRAKGAKVPSDLSGMEAASQLHWFVNQISPWLLTHEVPLRRRSKAQLEGVKATTRCRICNFMSAWGV